ncbi:hypothetical protein HGI30_04200 [Paenibacillus albicereus]|uniref:Uncharacterized protein n=1 Tax=Paenibacillus albicereus TaxID=2726185 RepID=A0A6H2GTX2_9BACL|nr:hypothetical protein [Paenibacillus albicereus]QJC50842.1 hypothetical protein HGI30_04200 [Paenibacillus albicereus]
MSSRTWKASKEWSWRRVAIGLGLAAFLVLGYLANADLPWRTTLEKQGISPGGAGEIDRIHIFRMEDGQLKETSIKADSLAHMTALLEALAPMKLARGPFSPEPAIGGISNSYSVSIYEKGRLDDPTMVSLKSGTVSISNRKASDSYTITGGFDLEKFDRLIESMKGE